MAKTKRLVVGNWKMFPERMEDAKKIVADVRRIIPKVRKTNVVLCPPHIYIPLFSGIKRGPLHLGAQDTHELPNGSITGEVSVSQIEQFNVDYIIAGHSERRKMGESDDLIARKVKAVIDYGMTAILCIGESVRDNHGDYLSFVRNQIITGLRGIEKKNLDKVVIAYEPIWAIGAKEAMEPRDVHEMGIFVRKVLRDTFGDSARDIPVLYGGAADKFNAGAIVKEGDVSGLLVGRQSLVYKDFVEIIKSIDAI